MTEHREPQDIFRQKRGVLADLPLDSCYKAPEFTTISAAKGRKNPPKRPKKTPKLPNKNKCFSVKDLFLTDG